MCQIDSPAHTIDLGSTDLCTYMNKQSQDWIKISEMLLGPVPDGFQFQPKHKANSYSTTASDMGVSNG